MNHSDPATNKHPEAPLEIKARREARPSIMQIAIDGTIQFFSSVREMMDQNEALRDQKQSFRDF